MRDFITYLNENGIKAEIKFTQCYGGNNEFYLVQLLSDGTENVIFSNNKSKHPKALTGSFDSGIYESLQSKIAF